MIFFGVQRSVNTWTHLDTYKYWVTHGNTCILRGILTGRIKNNPVYEESACFYLQHLVNGTFSGSNYEVVCGKFRLLTKTAIERAIKKERTANKTVKCQTCNLKTHVSITYKADWVPGRSLQEWDCNQRHIPRLMSNLKEIPFFPLSNSTFTNALRDLESSR